MEAKKLIRFSLLIFRCMQLVLFFMILEMIFYFLLFAGSLLESKHGKVKFFAAENLSSVASAKTEGEASGYMDMLKENVDLLGSPDKTKTGFTVAGAKSFVDTSRPVGTLLVYAAVGANLPNQTLKAFIAGRKSLEDVKFTDLKYFFELYGKKETVFAVDLEAKGRALIQKDEGSQNPLLEEAAFRDEAVKKQKKRETEEVVRSSDVSRWIATANKAFPGTLPVEVKKDVVDEFKDSLSKGKNPSDAWVDAMKKYTTTKRRNGKNYQEIIKPDFS